MVSVTGTISTNFPFMLDSYQILSSKQEVSSICAINTCFRKTFKIISFHFSLSLIYLRVLRISLQGALSCINFSNYMFTRKYNIYNRPTHNLLFPLH